MTSASTLQRVRPASAAPASPAAHDSPAPRRAPRPSLRAGRALRSVVFWLHLAVGVATGVVVLVMSATGTALAFQRQLLDWSASRHMVAAPHGATTLPLDTLLARARAELPGEQARAISAITVSRDGSAPVKLGLSARRYAYVDPYTARVLPASQGLQTFFFEMERWHRSTGLGEGLRGKPGVTITGAANLGFLFLVMTGVILWLPRQLSWRAFRAVLLLEPRARGRQRDWNWHHALGIWSAPVLFFLVLSGVFISYQWPTKLLERMMGEAPAAAATAAPARGGGGGGGGGGGAAATGAGGAARAASPAEPGVSLETVLARTRAVAGDDWATIQLRVPRAPDAPIGVTIATTTAVRPDARTALTFDAASGEMKREPGYATLTPARQLRSWVRGVHTGEVGGAVGQAVAGAACLAAVVLVWTGVALAWRRFLRTVRRRERALA